VSIYSEDTYKKSFLIRLLNLKMLFEIIIINADELTLLILHFSTSMTSHEKLNIKQNFML